MKLSNINSEGTFILPAGRLIQNVTIEELNGSSIRGGIRFGLSHGEGDLIGGIPVEANKTIPTAINSQFIDLNNDTTIYYDSVGDWNGALVNIYVVMQDILGA